MNAFEIIAGIAEIAEIIIAIAAVIISVKTWESQSEHNKNSVRPILNVTDCDYENILCIRLDNKGVGPAIITDIEFTSSYCGNTAMSNNIVELLPTAAVLNKDDGSYEYIDMNICFNTFVEDLTGRTIAQQDSVVLLQINFDETSEKNALLHLAIRNYLSNCSVSVEYSNIYNEKMSVCYHDFSFFGRTVDSLEDIEYSEKRISL